MAAGRHRRSPRAGTKTSVTLTAVARMARVGESTVSRVLRNQGSFSTQTRDDVLAAVAKLGYVPNRIAGTLASTKSRLIAEYDPSQEEAMIESMLAWRPAPALTYRLTMRAGVRHTLDIGAMSAIPYTDAARFDRLPRSPRSMRNWRCPAGHGVS